MNELDKDFELLNEDYERLVALESIGATPDNPAISNTIRRWALDDLVIVGTEASAKAVAAKSGKYALALAARFSDWAAAYGNEYKKKIADLVSKASTIERDCEKLRGKLELLDALPDHPVYTGRWTSEVCIEDKLSPMECAHWLTHCEGTDNFIKEYTVRIRTGLGKARVKEEDFRRLGKSSARAVKRATGILGMLNPGKEVTAYPLPGNVTVVVQGGGNHAEKVTFAIAQDGDYGDTIPQLTIEQCREALKAVYGAAKVLRERGVGRKAVGYTGINDEIESMKKSLAGMEGDELKDATLRYKNAVSMENAYTTAIARSCTGLLDYVRSSIARKV